MTSFKKICRQEKVPNLGVTPSWDKIIKVK